MTRSLYLEAQPQATRAMYLHTPRSRAALPAVKAHVSQPDSNVGSTRDFKILPFVVRDMRLEKNTAMLPLASLAFLASLSFS